MFWKFSALLLGLFLLVGQPAFGQQVSLLQPEYLRQNRQPLFGARSTSSETPVTYQGASLFVGQNGTSLFAPYPRRQRQAVHFALPPAVGSQIDRVRALIGEAESGAQSYDAVIYEASVRPPKRPTEMTIQEIFDWIEATPGQHHAIGHYQFIPPTLRRLVGQLGLSPERLFNKQTQDQLGDILLADAGLNAFRAGDMERHTLMNNMAKIWAGLPNSSGLSHYEGIAGNHATISWDYFDQEMAKIFPS